MIQPEVFATYLNSKGFRFYTGVPCSYFKSLIAHTENHPVYSYYAAPNEGSALAAASGAFLAGKDAVVMIQNSGLGNLINPLTSLSMIYELPVLLLISGRAYGIPDEPQHEIMGKTMGAILDAIGIRHWDLPQDENWQASLEEGLRIMRESQKPVVFFVRNKTFAPLGHSRTLLGGNPESHGSPTKAFGDDSVLCSPLDVKEQRFPMKRMDAISIIRDALPEDAAVFATTGKISREFFAAADRPGNFYMQGSMGHVSALALGYALANPEKRVVALDGDGAFLMHMGMASMIGHYEPRNLLHILLDNESYETTGDQDTTASSTDFETIARASGYKKTAKAVNAETLQSLLADFKNAEGPAFLWVKINRLETSGIPRITTKYSAPEITRNFQEFSRLRKTGRV